MRIIARAKRGEAQPSRLALDGSAVNAMVVTKSGLLVQTAAGMLALVRF